MEDFCNADIFISTAPITAIHYKTFLYYAFSRQLPLHRIITAPFSHSAETVLERLIYTFAGILHLFI